MLILFFIVLPFIARTPPGVSGPRWRPFGLRGIAVHYLVLDPRSHVLAFAATEKGVYRYHSNEGWTRTLNVFGVWSAALLPDDKTVIAGENDGHVDVSPDDGMTWRRALVAPKGVFAVTADPGHPHVLLAGAGGGIYLSPDKGKHWRRVLRLHNSAVAAFAQFPRGRALFAGAVSGGSGGSTAVYISRDGGHTWSVFGRDLNSMGGIMSLAVTDRSRPQLIAGTMGNAAAEAAYKTGIWHKAAHGMPSVNDHVSGIAGDPARPRTIFAATLAYGVFRSDDGGAHWTSISRGLPANANAKIALSVVYSSQQRALYAGTLNGVYVLRHIK
jgi:hypothetical protein